VKAVELPLPVLAFLMVFAAAACTLLLVGLWAIIVRLIIALTLFLRFIAALERFLIESSYRLINGLVQGTYELRGRAANTAQRFLVVTKQKQDKEKATDELPLAARLLKSILSDEDREHIIGDVIEEFSLFESKLKAYLWLYKQVLTSAWPLICKTVERNLASMFKKRIR
jgi:hypothetical protein